MTAVILSIESRYHSHRSPFHDVAFADDILGSKSLESLKRWCDEIWILTPFIGHYVNTTNSWPIVKNHEIDKAKQVFDGTRTKITADGRSWDNWNTCEQQSIFKEKSRKMV